MRTIDWYMDQARERANIPSDNKLGVRLGISGNSVNQWRTKRAWPADDTMVHLAQLAGEDVTQALLDLNVWRAKTPEVVKAYSSLLEKIGRSAAAVLMGFAILTWLNDAKAHVVNNSPSTQSITAYYDADGWVIARPS